VLSSTRSSSRGYGMNFTADIASKIDWYSIAIGAVLATLIAFLFYRLQIAVKSPVYSVKSINIIQESLSKITDLKVTFKEQRVSNLNAVAVAFWNSGRRAIRRGDLVPGFVRFEISSGNILDCGIQYFDASKNNNIRVELDQQHQNAVLLSFDYLDNNDGCVLKFYHNNSGIAKVQSSAEIIESKSIREVPLVFGRAEPIGSSTNRRDDVRSVFSRLGRILLVNPWQMCLMSVFIAGTFGYALVRLPELRIGDVGPIVAVLIVYTIVFGVIAFASFVVALRFPRPPRKILSALKDAI
jgi:hypothetical protein